ncbi:MAG TPA: APC family permease [Candidatus Limnocylindrales bacterium]
MAVQSATGVSVAQTGLKAGALKLPSIFMQSLTMVAPGIAALFYTPFIVGQAGLAAPLAYPIAFVIVLLTAIVLAQLARAVPSAGGYYTYVSRGMNPHFGFLVSWLNIIYAPLVLGAVTVFGGWVVSSSLGWPDWFPLAFMVVAVSIVAVIQYRGVQVSGKTLVITGGIELVVVSVLGLWSLASPGPGGLNLKPFDPGNATSISGLFLAAVFAIQAFTGWEGAAPMAEESENPRRNVPRALIGSVILFGIFIVVMQWGVMVGWGTDNFKDIPAASPLPGIQLAQRFWGGAWGILLVMLVSSVIAVSIACANVGTRMWYRMGVDGAFPKWFAKVHPEYRTPVNAIIAQWVLALATGFGLTGFALIATPNAADGTAPTLNVAVQNQYFIDGTIIGFVVLLIYSLGNIAAFNLYWRERRSEFNWLLHGLFPLLSTLGMILVGLFAIGLIGGDPLTIGGGTFPAAPFNYAVIFVGIWTVVGVLVLVYMRATGKVDWIQRAGDAASERPPTPDELREMSGEW